MKRIPLLVAAAIPLAVNAAADKDLANWDNSSIDGHMRVTNVMDSEVYMQGGREVGEIRDVVFDRDGNVASVIVESNGRNVTSTQATMTDGNREQELESGDGLNSSQDSDRRLDDESATETLRRNDNPVTEDNTNYMATDDISRTGGIDYSDDSIAEVSWDEVNYDRTREAVQLTADNVDFTRAAANGEVEPTSGFITASDVIGMEVSLADADSFGRVEDVLIADDGSISAFVVDSWDLADKERYALPADMNAVDNQRAEINFDYNESDVRDLEEYDFDAFSEEF